MNDWQIKTYHEEYRRIKMWLFLNLLLYITVEAVSSFNLLERAEFLVKHMDIFLINYIILLTITCPCLLFPKMTFVFNLFGIGVLTITYASRILMVIRGMPLRWPDFFIAKEGMSIASKYLSASMILLILMLIGIAFLLLVKSYSYQIKLYHPKIMICFMVLITSLNLVVVSKAQKITEIETDEMLDYSKYGVVYSFLSSYEAAEDIVPENYSLDTIKNLQRKLEVQKIGDVTSENPNILFLQVESFVDPYSLKGVTYNRDPIPHMRPYMTGEWSGHMEMPGINTARTEFEVLTGIRIAHLFKYEVPYTSDALDGRPIETIAQILKKTRNYHTTAIHNHEASFYQRDIVYNTLGFQNFIPVEYMEGITYTKNWPKDEILLKYIQQTLENTPNRDFIFTVTVGMHSSYDYKYTDNTSGIEIGGIEEEQVRNQLQDYIDRLVETDQFIGSTIAYVQQLEEPTILVIYGDHIPALDVITYDEDYIKDQVPYFIVSNYKLKGRGKPLTQAYRLYTDLLNTIEIPGGTISAVHNVFNNTQEYYQILDLAAYDLLMGNRYITGEKDVYESTSLQIGTP